MHILCPLCKKKKKKILALSNRSVLVRLFLNTHQIPHAAFSLLYLLFPGIVPSNVTFPVKCRQGAWTWEMTMMWMSSQPALAVSSLNSTSKWPQKTTNLAIVKVAKTAARSTFPSALTMRTRCYLSRYSRHLISQPRTSAAAPTLMSRSTCCQIENRSSRHESIVKLSTPRLMSPSSFRYPMMSFPSGSSISVFSTLTGSHGTIWSGRSYWTICLKRLISQGRPPSGKTFSMLPL